jgi:glycerol-3-phosphate acyltransferase PlsY
MQIFDFSWIIFSYLLGSIPFGYIITKLSTKKNILDVGWKKTSGSNVFKNIGMWQGILTGLLDAGKGFLAVKIAQTFGFSGSIQALSGVAAVAGHNWSYFLKLSGGRGIGTFLGAALALSPTILWQPLMFFLILTLLWDSSIGTIFLLASFIIISTTSGFEAGKLFGLVSLIPIFIKRLSPIKELGRSQNRTALIKSRLLFDDNHLHLEPRIKRIVQRLTK